MKKESLYITIKLHVAVLCSKTASSSYSLLLVSPIVFDTLDKIERFYKIKTKSLILCGIALKHLFLFGN